MRVILGTPSSARNGDDGHPGHAILLEANVDDLDPRVCPSVLADLLEHGASTPG